MLKSLNSLCNSRISRITLCRCQLVPTKVTKFSKNRIHNRQHINSYYEFKRPHFGIAFSGALPRSYCSSVNLDDIISENDALGEMLDESHEYLENGFGQIKDFLYQNLSSEDELLVQISNCSSEDVLMGTVKKNSDKIARHHAVLSVVKLWHCKNAKAKMLNEAEADATNNENLQSLLDKVLLYASEMTLDELTVCFLYLTKLSVKMQTDVMSTVLELILKFIKNVESADIPLSALSRFAVAVNINPQLYMYFIYQHILPHVFYHLDRVTASSELRLLTICLNNIHQLISPDSMELFVKKVHQFIAEDKMKDDSRTILKVVQFLSFPHWSQHHLPSIRTLLLQLQDKIHNFNARELEFVGMIFQANFEPATIGKTIATYATKLLEKSSTAEVLSCTVLHSTPSNRQKLTELAKDFLFTNSNPDCDTLASLFKILRHLKVSDTSICNEYWSKVTRKIISSPAQQETHQLTRHCHRYMHFNNNLNGTYRHIPFEKTVVKLLIDDLDKGISCLLPAKFTKAASFILGYGHTPRDRFIFPEFIIQKLEAMQQQFTIFDCLQLTRGIQIAVQMRFRKEVHSELASQIIRLENVFNACTERHLNQPDISLNDLNCIVRSYTNRKSPMKTAIYRKIIEKYEVIPHHPLTSRIIRDITFNLNVAKYKIPSLCDSLNEYIVKNHEFVLGDTVQKVLFCFYNLNYYPNDETIFQHATEIINRDFDTMSGLAIVEACLALAFYKELPGSLIDRVFNISFIQRLEDEIEMCYSKAFYPQRVLNSVMQLNRAVCLDFPESRVPWFQQNYIEAQLTKVPVIKNKFHNDVKQVLINFTTDENLLKMNYIAPYGYKIDFVLYFDAYKKLLQPSTLNDAVRQINKVAIVLLNTDEFCQNDYQNVRGKEALKQRHLEIMGFRVVQINHKQWNSMYMNLPGAKVDYVRGLLT